MRLPAPLLEAQFLSRPNRFTCLVQLADRRTPVPAHLPDPGRLHELLRPGVRLWLEPKSDVKRKTPYQVWLVENNRTFVSLNTQLPNLLVREALRLKKIPELTQYHHWQQERKISGSRLDFHLESAEERCWVEVKSVTLVEGGRGLFPDAPTARGRKHVVELTKLRQAGDRAIVFFVVQRADALSVAPNRCTDPDFAVALKAAVKNGVELIAYTCQITPEFAALYQRIPVKLA